MNYFVTLLISAIAAISLVVVVNLYVKYRKILKERNSYIVSNVREKDQLIRELGRMRIEKEALERMITSQMRDNLPLVDENGTPLVKDNSKEIVFTGKAHFLKTS